MRPTNPTSEIDERHLPHQIPEGLPIFITCSSNETASSGRTNRTTSSRFLVGSRAFCRTDNPVRCAVCRTDRIDRSTFGLRRNRVGRPLAARRSRVRSDQRLHREQSSHRRRNRSRSSSSRRDQDVTLISFVCVAGRSITPFRNNRCNRNLSSSGPRFFRQVAWFSSFLIEELTLRTIRIVFQVTGSQLRTAFWL